MCYRGISLVLLFLTGIDKINNTIMNHMYFGIEPFCLNLKHIVVIVNIFLFIFLCNFQCRALHKRLLVTNCDKEKLQSDLEKAQQNIAQLKVRL